MTNSTDAHRRLPAALATAMALAVLAVAAPAAGAAEGRCAKAVQGEIAWDYAGSTSWAEANVNRLCQGAEDSVEPARCFDRVMHGGVSRGGSTRWEWADALDLCRGTLDAEATISCFEKRQAARMPWKEAIAACRWDKPSPEIVLDPSVTLRTPTLPPGTRARIEAAGEAAGAATRRAAECDTNPDSDGDGRNDIVCGGDDCDDSDANRFPGNVELCDDGDHDEDCDPETFGKRDADGDGYVAESCCNRQPDGSSICGVDCDDLRRAIVPGAQSCADETTVYVCGSGLASCSRDGSRVCAPQPNGTGVCVPR